MSIHDSKLSRFLQPAGPGELLYWLLFDFSSRFRHDGDAVELEAGGPASFRGVRMSAWRAAGVVAEGQPIAIQGVNVWNHRWIQRGEEAVDLPHPSYPEQRHRMRVYEIEGGENILVFAASELSPGVWGFFVPA